MSEVDISPRLASFRGYSKVNRITSDWICPSVGAGDGRLQKVARVTEPRRSRVDTAADSRTNCRAKGRKADRQGSHLRYLLMRDRNGGDDEATGSYECVAHTLNNLNDNDLGGS